MRHDNMVDLRTTKSYPTTAQRQQAIGTWMFRLRKIQTATQSSQD